MARIIDVIDHVNVANDELAYREPQMGGGDWRWRKCSPASCG